MTSIRWSTDHLGTDMPARSQTYRSQGGGVRAAASWTGGILTAMAEPSSARSSGGAATNSRSWPVKRTESFGGVVVREGESGHEVALIRVRNLKGKDVWA